MNAILLVKLCCVKTAHLPTSALESNLDNFSFSFTCYSVVPPFPCWPSSGMWYCQVFSLSASALSMLRPAASLALVSDPQGPATSLTSTSSARMCCSLLQQHKCIKVPFFLSWLHRVLSMVRTKHCLQSLQNVLIWKEPTSIIKPSSWVNGPYRIESMTLALLVPYSNCLPLKHLLVVRRVGFFRRSNLTSGFFIETLDC